MYPHVESVRPLREGTRDLTEGTHRQYSLAEAGLVAEHTEQAEARRGPLVAPPDRRHPRRRVSPSSARRMLHDTHTLTCHAAASRQVVSR